MHAEPTDHGGPGPVRMTAAERAAIFPRSPGSYRARVCYDEDTLPPAWAVLFIQIPKASTVINVTVCPDDATRGGLNTGTALACFMFLLGVDLPEGVEEIPADLLKRFRPDHSYHDGTGAIELVYDLERFQPEPEEVR